MNTSAATLATRPPAYTIMGTSSDITTCEACGKSDLRCTVALSNGEGVVHFGRDCAAKALLGSKNRKNVARIDLISRLVDTARKTWAKYGDKGAEARVWTIYGVPNSVVNGTLTCALGAFDVS